MSSNRPDIELALDVRSDEKVIVITGQESEHQYPERWLKPTRLSDLAVDEMSVVIIDRVEVQRRTLAQIAEGCPRLVAFAVANVDHEKQVRRLVTSLFPWSEVWTMFTSFGKILVSKDIRGEAYDHNQVVDMRPEALAS